MESYRPIYATLYVAQLMLNFGEKYMLFSFFH